jgi:hypothetical protein
MIIKILDYDKEFAENKDVAAILREDFIRPAVNSGEEVVLDFSGVNLTTQSFLHAMITDVLRKGGEATLDIVSFKGCSELVRELVAAVVQYSLETVG